MKIVFFTETEEAGYVEMFLNTKKDAKKLR